MLAFLTAAAASGVGGFILKFAVDFALGYFRDRRNEEALREQGRSQIREDMRREGDVTAKKSEEKRNEVRAGDHHDAIDRL
jgi:hypothetical protein